jgi:hypothetical protein
MFPMLSAFTSSMACWVGWLIQGVEKTSWWLLHVTLLLSPMLCTWSSCYHAQTMQVFNGPGSLYLVRVAGTSLSSGQSLGLTTTLPNCDPSTSIWSLWLHRQISYELASLMWMKSSYCHWCSSAMQAKLVCHGMRGISTPKLGPLGVYNPVKPI